MPGKPSSAESRGSASRYATTISDQTQRPGSKQSKTSSRGDGVNDDDFDPEKVAARQREVAMKVCSDLCIFLCFLLSFTITVVLAHSADSAAFVDRVNYFVEARNSTFPLSRVESIDSFYNYFELSFIEFLNKNETDRIFAEEQVSQVLRPLDSANKMFGAVQVRQVRSVQQGELWDCDAGAVSGTSCVVGANFVNYNTTCFPEYSVETHSEEAYGLSADCSSSMVLGQMCCSSSKPFNFEARPEESSITGKIATYEPGGFFMPLTNNATVWAQNLQQYKALGFVDTGTRAIFVEFTVYNPNLNQYAVTRLIFEFSASGAVYVTKRISVLTPRLLEFFKSNSMSDQIANILEIVVIVFVLYYIAEELSEISLSRWEYFEDGWNFLDWTNMALLLIAQTLRLAAYMDVSSFSPLLGVGEIDENNGQTAYTDLQGVASKVESARMFNSFNAILLWGKCIKYIGYFPYISFLFHTIKKAMGAFWSFAVLFFCCFFGFVVCFLIAFGDVLRDLSALDKTIVYLARGFVADVDVLPIYEVAPAMGGILILLYYIVIIVVGVNIFFSIMASTLVEEQYNPSEKTSDTKEQAIVMVWEIFTTKVSNMFKLERRIKAISPALHRRIYGNKDEKNKKKNEEFSAIEDKLPSDKKKKKRGASETKSADSPKAMSQTTRSALEGGPKPIRDFTPKEVMCGVENMAGRVLSKMHGVGIEIRIEMLRVQESLNQMITVSETLAGRINKIESSQKNLLEDLAEA